MKKVVIIALVVLLVAALGITLIACNFFEDTSLGRAISSPFKKHEIIYQASTRFLYSTDGGASWSDSGGFSEYYILPCC